MSQYTLDRQTLRLSRTPDSHPPAITTEMLARKLGVPPVMLLNPLRHLGTYPTSPMFAGSRPPVIRRWAEAEEARRAAQRAPTATRSS